MSSTIVEPISVETVDGTAVELRNFGVRVAGKTLLRHVNARFEPAEVTLVVGPSGAGKSVLLKALAGLIPADDTTMQLSGVVRVGNQSSSHPRPNEVGVVFQDFALLDELTPVENIKLARDHRRRSDSPVPSVDDLLLDLQIPRNTPTGALSGGQRQRLAIARTLAYNAPVILYDEPTSGLDTATSAIVARQIRETHEQHGKTSIIVTHDYESLAEIADRIYLLDPHRQTLIEVSVREIRSRLQPATQESNQLATRRERGRLAVVGDWFSGTSKVIEATITSPLSLIPTWRNIRWGLRFLLHYLVLIAGPSAWAYLAISGAIIGFVTTYFTFKFLPYAGYTEPLIIEDLLASMGFALFRILVPVLATILIAARCGAAIASDVGGKSYGQQLSALRTIGIWPRGYLFTGVLWSFVLATPILVLLAYAVAAGTSLLVFVSTHTDYGGLFWQQHFHEYLVGQSYWWYQGSGWLLAKVLVCALVIGSVSYHLGIRRKLSGHDVSKGITQTILWSTLLVLVVHFAFAFIEFD